jgi:alkanesulfonate monooxygenase SsuD/methylene tetrahydromethanopterin reductase-like flavin-dependent oxidoreductase (luciferase family)
VAVGSLQRGRLRVRPRGHVHRVSTMGGGAPSDVGLDRTCRVRCGSFIGSPLLDRLDRTILRMGAATSGNCVRRHLRCPSQTERYALLRVPRRRDARQKRPVLPRGLATDGREGLGITPDEIEGGHCVALTRPRDLADRLDSFFSNDMRSGLWLPLFEELADPRAVARLASDAEELGWHGLFVWDQMRWREPIQHVADPWITLAAVATATEGLKLGPMVTPLPRRRPAKVARETATLDGLSGGRLILGVGLGGDQFAGEFSKTGEQVDDRARGEMLDEALEILSGAWSGEPVNHRGKHYLIDDVRFLPRPVQEPRIPVWVAAFPGNVKPLRRAARYEGFFPVNLANVDEFARAVSTVRELRADSTARFEIAAALPPGSDVAPYAEAGATWWMTAFEPGVPLDDVRAVVREGPAR